MLVLTVARALTHAFVETVVADPSARRAALAATDGAFAPLALALHDPATALAATASVATRTTAAATGASADAEGALDIVERDLARFASGDFIGALGETAAEKAVGLAAGAAAEVGTGGELSMLDGLSLTRGLGGGLVAGPSPARIAERLGRAVAAAGAGGIAAAIADPEDGAAAFRYGARLALRGGSLAAGEGPGAIAVAAGLGVEVTTGAVARASDPTRPWTEALGFGRGVGAGLERMVDGVGAVPLAAMAGGGAGVARIGAEVVERARDDAVRAREARASAREDPHLIRAARRAREQVHATTRLRSAASHVEHAADVTARCAARLVDGPVTR